MKGLLHLQHFLYFHFQVIFFLNQVSILICHLLQYDSMQFFNLSGAVWIENFLNFFKSCWLRNMTNLYCSILGPAGLEKFLCHTATPQS
jgi:hypothetical protein